MVRWVPTEFRFYQRHCQGLKRLLRNTTSALNEISSVLQIGCDEVGEDPLNDSLTTLLKKTDRQPFMLVFGQDCHAKALFVNKLLAEPILPLFSSQWRHVIFKYGLSKSLHLTLGADIEIVENLQALENPWITIPEEDLRLADGENIFDNHCPSLEVVLNYRMLKDNVQIMVPPDCQPDQLNELAKKLPKNILPVIIYALYDEKLSDDNIQEIRKLKEIFPIPFLFVSVSSSISKAQLAKAMTDLSIESLTESEKHVVENCKEENDIKLQTLKDQLIRLGYISNVAKSHNCDMDKKLFCYECSSENILISEKTLNVDFACYVLAVLRSSVLRIATNLSEMHNKVLKKFILCAFDMAREIQITPRRIAYAQEIEMKLYKTLMKIACEQHEEIALIIHKTLQDMKSNVAEVLEGFNANNSSMQMSAKIATWEIQQLVLKRLSESVSIQIVKSAGCLQESFIGTLQRCLESLEKNCQDLEGNMSASDAVKQIITAAYNIDVKNSTSFSMVHTFMDRLRNILSTFALPWSQSSQVQCSLQWQLQVVTNIVDSLSASKLAKTVSVQFQEHIKSAHESFQSAMRNLENQLSGQLEHTEEQRIAIRKKHAPKFAKLALESMSMCDRLRWGMPKQIKEIGRGQYGVVSSCEPWGGVDPCAFKSVVPPDERHWNDLAMEFYYTRTIPEHPRIVKLRGSVMDHGYGGGNSLAVLLMMERMTRDLYCGLRNGLSWVARLRIAIDVIEGIRYLHSQGLVHRDIKLKNVLLDNNDRAKLTDFGFCIPEAMMSGSIVGTPVHMAPELLSGKYDANVDTYAFGILFWYLCAGQVKLPNHFDQCQSKEQLWDSVCKGTRPEYLPIFDDACWKLMEQCWSAEPSQRPLLGDVQTQVEAIFQTALLAESNQGQLSFSPKSYRLANFKNYRGPDRDECYDNPNFFDFREY